MIVKMIFNTDVVRHTQKYLSTWKCPHRIMPAESHKTQNHIQADYIFQSLKQSLVITSHQSLVITRTMVSRFPWTPQKSYHHRKLCSAQIFSTTENCSPVESCKMLCIVSRTRWAACGSDFRLSNLKQQKSCLDYTDDGGEQQGSST